MSLVQFFLGILLAAYASIFSMTRCSSGEGEDSYSGGIDNYGIAVIGEKRSASSGPFLSGKRARKISIFEAIGDGNYELVNKLINHREFDMDARNNVGQTPLIVAAQCGDSNMVESLLEYCVSLDAINSSCDATISSCDIMNESLSAMDDCDRNALFYAVEQNNVDVIRVLAEYCNRDRDRFEDAMLFAAALVPPVIDGQDNQYCQEIYSMLIEPSAIQSAGKHTHDFIKKIIVLEEVIKQLRSTLDDALLSEDYICRHVSKEQLEEKNLSWLRIRYNKLLKIRDAICKDRDIAVQRAASMALLEKGSEIKTGVRIKRRRKRRLKTEEKTKHETEIRSTPLLFTAQLPVVKSCFACCVTDEDACITKINLLPIPCNYCSEKEIYVCCECLPQLNGTCSFCQQRFDGLPTT